MNSNLKAYRIVTRNSVLSTEEHIVLAKNYGEAEELYKEVLKGYHDIESISEMTSVKSVAYSTRGMTYDDINSYIHYMQNPKDTDKIQDGFTSFGRLYQYKSLFGAAMINFMSKYTRIFTYKARKDSYGKDYMDGNAFIVVAHLAEGNAAFLIPLKDWGMFHCPEQDKAEPLSDYTYEQGLESLRKYCVSFRDED